MANMIGFIAQHDVNSMQCVLEPTFTWQPGQLHLMEQQMLNTLSGQRVNLDHKFTVQLHRKPDQRDSRPLNIPGRIVMPLLPPKAPLQGLQAR